MAVILDEDLVHKRRTASMERNFLRNKLSGSLYPITAQNILLSFEKSTWIPTLVYFGVSFGHLSQAWEQIFPVV